MTPGLWVAAGVAFVLLIMVIAMFNALVGARQRVRESWSDVDTELKRRHDLIPNLVATVKGYMKHERDVLERLTELRSRAEGLRPGSPSSAQLAVEGQLGGLLHTVAMRMEAYPDLKASANTLALQRELANTEDRIAAALRYYNGNVRDLNTKCESFPSNLIAGMFKFELAEFFKLDSPSQRAAPDVSV